MPYDITGLTSWTPTSTESHNQPVFAFGACPQCGAIFSRPTFCEGLQMHVPADIRRDPKQKDRPPQNERCAHPTPIIPQTQELWEQVGARRQNDVEARHFGGYT